MRQALGRLPPDGLLELHERYSGYYPVLLESIGEDARLGRYDLLFAQPGERLIRHADGTLEGPGAGAGGGTFLEALDAWWIEERDAPDSQDGLPFCGGWFLYLGYELAEEVEPRLRLQKSLLPRAVAWRMSAALLRDRATGEVIACAEPGAQDLLAARLQSDLATCGNGSADASSDLLLDIEEDEPRQFIDGVSAILESIGRGDVYQANLSRGWRGRVPDGVNAATLYRRLRAANPGPFSGSARMDGFTLLSSSPERLLRIEGSTASTRPIAGTRPRGSTSASDASLRSELKLNEKERAEHVMLVDLERNDLGRVCRGGTVRVDEFMTIESYATVHHIVSNVRGELRDGVTPGEAIAAVFPGGTITGCPKVRCMELLAALERSPRDAYTGSIGYLRRDGGLDLNILIRTIVLRDGTLEFRTGAGIVADSHPEAELAETRAKARGLLRALGSGK